MTKLASLNLLQHRAIGDCQRCPLSKTRKHIVFARGDANAPLMFIGEAPGADEDEQGLPFVGKAGQLLDDIIRAMGWSPETVYIANVIKCRPPDNRYPTPKEVATCSPFLWQQIEIKQPAVLVTLGNLATKTILGETKGIMSIRGQWREMEIVREALRGKLPIMPTFHPSFLLRQPSGKRYVWKDVQLVVAKLRQLGFPPPHPIVRRRT